MKSKMLASLMCFMFSVNPAVLFAQDDTDILHREITEGKIAAAEIMMIEELTKEVAEKQLKAAQLIAFLGDAANSRIGDETLKEEMQYVHSGFIARLQGIREDQEALAKKEIRLDLEALNNFSRRLDSLIADIKLYLK